MMTLDEAIKREEKIEKQLIERVNALDNIPLFGMDKDDKKQIEECYKCAEEHRQLAEWLKELRVFKSRKGQWLRMSDLSEQKDDRYKCSHCGNVIHRKNKMDLYTFNSWCGRCGSDNGRN